MILTDICQYLRINRKGTLPEIARSFNIGSDVALSILNKLIAKKRVKVVREKNLCGGCSRCDQNVTELYVWCSPMSSPILPRGVTF